MTTNKKKYAVIVLGIVGYTLAGAVVGSAVAYLLGMLGGIGLTFYNNNFLADTAQGSYMWWAKFCGYLSAVFAVIPSALLGFVIKIYRLATASN